MGGIAIGQCELAEGHPPASHARAGLTQRQTRPCDHGKEPATAQAAIDSAVRDLWSFIH